MSDLYPNWISKSDLRGRLRRLEVGAQRLQRNTLRPTSGQYTRIPINALKANSPTQSIDISGKGVRKIGSTPVSANSAGFAYTATDSTITWYWDGSNSSHVITIHRSDGTSFNVPTFGSGLTVSGLSAATTYYFLPFWGVHSSCNISWVPGTTGIPQIAFVVGDTTDAVLSPQYLIRQALAGNEPLTSGFMTASTASGGGSGGGGGGGGGAPGRCVMAGTDIQTLGDLPYSINVVGEIEWTHLRVRDGRDLFCSFDHMLYHPTRGKIMADTLEEGDSVITDHGEQDLITAERVKRKCSKWEIIMKEGHLYWANGFLSHNQKYSLF